MRTGLRPTTIRQIFSPVPAARSRCLSAFVAIARNNLPLMLRYEASHLLALIGVCLLIVGFFTDSLMRFGGTMILAGWGLLGLAFLATLGQDRLIYGKSRSRLIRQLDEVRRSVGLDDAILPESLEFLEAAAQQWERVEHSLQSHAWEGQEHIKTRIDAVAHQTMENIVVLECGTTAEAGLSDLEADQSLAQLAANLSILADRVDASSAAMMTYPRENYESTGVPATGVIPEMDALEEILQTLGGPIRSA